MLNQLIMILKSYCERIKISIASSYFEIYFLTPNVQELTDKQLINIKIGSKCLF